MKTKGTVRAWFTLGACVKVEGVWVGVARFALLCNAVKSLPSWPCTLRFAGVVPQVKLAKKYVVVQGA